MFNLGKTFWWLRRKESNPGRQAAGVKDGQRLWSRRPILKERRRDPLPRTASELVPIHRNFHVRALHRAWRRFIDGSLSHWTTTLIIALSLTIFGAFSLVLTNLDAVISKWKIDNSMNVFMQATASPDVLRETLDRLAQLPAVASVQVITPEAAMRRLKAMLGSEAAFLDEIDDNPLPHSLEVAIKDENADQITVLSKNVSTWKGVATVVYDRQWLDRLTAVIRAIRHIGNIFSFLLLAAVALIISNTIKLTIIARRDEVEVMRFMGATDGFIKIPFVYEGILQGLLGSLIALVLMTGLYLGAQPAVSALERAFGFLLPWHFLPLPHLLAIFALGITLGLVGAILSISRFMEI